MECGDVRRKLSAYMEDLLSSEEKKMIDNHLSSCEQCAVRLEELKTTHSLVKGLDDMEPPPWLTQKIMTRVREEEDRNAGFLKKLFYPFSIKVPVQVLGIILIAVVAFQIYRTAEPDKPITHAPPLPSPSVKEKVVQEESSGFLGKTADAPRSPSARIPIDDKVAAEKDTRSAVGDSAREMDNQRRREQMPASPQPFGKTSRKMKLETAAENESSAAAPPPQTESLGEFRYEEIPHDEEKTDALLSGRGAEPKSRDVVLQEQSKEQPAPAAGTSVSLFVVQTKRLAHARAATENILKDLGGKDIEQISRSTGEVISADLPSGKIKEFHERLKTAGDLKTAPPLSELPPGIIRVRIEIIPE